MNLALQTIMICDDSMLIRKKMRASLEVIAPDFHIVEAANGEMAVELCKEEAPSLIFLDIVMPRKDGLEALQEIKAIDQRIVVVMASSVGTEAMLRKALESGADDFIQKPVQDDNLRSIVDKFTANRGEQLV